MSLHRLTVPYHLFPELQSKAWNVTWCLSMNSKNGPMGCLLFIPSCTSTVTGPRPVFAFSG